MSIKNILTPEAWEKLQRTHPIMDDLFYVCACETCGKVFFEATLKEVQQLMLNGEWNLEVPMQWYVDAAKHWLKAKFHSIRTYVDDKHGDKTIIKDLSKIWLASSKLKGLTDKQLEREIDLLEEQIKRFKQKR